MRRATAVTLLIALPAAAQPVETALLPEPSAPARLLLAHWPEGGWQIKQVGRRAEIAFPGDFLDISLAAVTPPPPAFAEKIAGLAVHRAASGTRLTVDLACDCAVAVSGDGEARLAIDIVGPSIPPGPLLRARGTAPARAPMPTARAAAERDGPPTNAEPAELAPEMAAARARLVAQLEKAAEAGLITLAEGAGPPRRGPSWSAPRAEAETEAEDEAQKGETLAVSGRGRTPVAETAAPADRLGDPANVALAPALPTSQAIEPPSVPRCLPDAAFALPEPVGSDAFAARLAALRAELIGEFDRPHKAGVDALIRFYLSHGLGREARRVIDAFELRDASASLPALSDLVEGEPTSEAGALAQNCPGAHGVWAAYAAALTQAEVPAPETADAVAERLTAMNEPLRTQIALRLARAAVEDGRNAVAKRFLSVARRGERAGRPPLPERSYVGALLARSEGRIGEALSALRGLWAEGGPFGEAALLKLSEMVLSGEITDHRDTHLLRLDLGALAGEARGSPLAAEALTAEARLAARPLGPEAALDLLAFGLADGTLDAESHAAGVEAVAADGAARPSIPLAILHEREPARYARALAEPGYRRALARSYAEIGLPARAAALVRPGDLRDTDLALALSRSHLAAGQPARGLEIAAELAPGPVRAEIEAAALDALGRPGEALERLEAAGAGSRETRIRLAWAAGDWAGAAEALARSVEESPTPGAEAKLALAEARAGQSRGRDLPAPEPAAIAAYLDTLRAETAAMREMLSDG